MSSHDDHEHVQITEDEVERFAAKLEEWGEQLPDEEKRLLRLMLSSVLATAEASGDVEGFDLAVQPPDPTDLLGRNHGCAAAHRVALRRQGCRPRLGGSVR